MLLSCLLIWIFQRPVDVSAEFAGRERCNTTYPKKMPQSVAQNLEKCITNRSSALREEAQFSLVDIFLDNISTLFSHPMTRFVLILFHGSKESVFACSRCLVQKLLAFRNVRST